MKMKIIASFLLVIALAVSGCQDPVPGPSKDKVGISVLPVFTGSPDKDPMAGVSYMRIAVDGDNGVKREVFVQYQKGAVNALDEIPFGKNLRLTVEGWSAGQDQGLGSLVSRGRSAFFNIDESTDPVNITVLLSRVNAFSPTTAYDQPTGARQTNMTEGRVGHSVTLLDDGRVVIIGGGTLVSGTNQFLKPQDLASVSASAEIYDPVSGIFSPIVVPGGSLSVARAFHTATLLPDGRILIAGGITVAAGQNKTINSIEVFNPMTQTFQVSQTTLQTERAAHTANLLDTSGHVAFVGGMTVSAGAGVATSSVEVHKANTGLVWSSNVAQARYFHTASAVEVGPDATKEEALVIIGGENQSGVLNSLETFYYLRAQPEISPDIKSLVGGPRTRHTANYVKKQRFVHVVGGYRDKDHVQVEDLIDSYDTTNQVFPNTNFRLLQGRAGHTAVTIENNTVFVFGGFANGAPINTSEVIFEFYNPQDNKVYIDRGGVGPMMSTRGNHEGVLLQNGTVLAVGGVGNGGNPNVIGEFFNPL